MLELGSTPEGLKKRRENGREARDSAMRSCVRARARAWYRNYSGGRPPKPTRAFDPRQRLRPLVATFLRRVCVFSLTGSPTIWPRPQLAALGSPVVGITLPHRISGTSTDEMWGEGALGGCLGGKSEGGRGGWGSDGRHADIIPKYLLFRGLRSPARP